MSLPFDADVIGNMYNPSGPSWHSCRSLVPSTVHMNATYASILLKGKSKSDKTYAIVAQDAAGSYGLPVLRVYEISNPPTHTESALTFVGSAGGRSHGVFVRLFVGGGYYRVP